jgi:hypothetical protein
MSGENVVAELLLSASFYSLEQHLANTKVSVRQTKRTAARTKEQPEPTKETTHRLSPWTRQFSSKTTRSRRGWQSDYCYWKVPTTHSVKPLGMGSVSHADVVSP